MGILVGYGNADLPSHLPGLMGVFIVGAVYLEV